MRVGDKLRGVTGEFMYKWGCVDCREGRGKYLYNKQLHVGEMEVGKKDEFGEVLWRSFANREFPVRCLATSGIWDAFFLLFFPPSSLE